MKKTALFLSFFGLCAVSCDRHPPVVTQQEVAEQMTEDQQITQRINDLLMNDSALSMSAKNIDVSTDNGVVTLQGRVASAREKDRVIRMTRATRGVKQVKDHLLIQN